MKMKYKWVKVPADQIDEIKELVHDDSENEKEGKSMKTSVKVALAVGLTTVAGGLGYLAGKLGSNKEEEDDFEPREYVEVNPQDPATEDTAD